MLAVTLFGTLNYLSDKMKLTNTLLYIFLSITIISLVTHSRKNTYFENPSSQLSEKIYNNGFVISTSLKSEGTGYSFDCSLNNIKAEIQIQDLQIGLSQIESEKENNLLLEKILPYSGMHNWDIPEFRSFSEIPDSLKFINSSSNPYFAYEFIFKLNPKYSGERFTAKITADFTKNGVRKKIAREVTMVRKSKFEIRPFDAHSDISYFFIPIAALLTVILVIIKQFLKRNGKLSTPK
ncbi:hypothetical protein [Pedobacter suwonensis]|uniref:hypothetical protein n=1 Tax=Pedobacter suwonensis TaxID=332999 RepID=UPI0011A4B4F0|nr:hypothetical protein [Pedobacter suwonensis]